MVMWVLSWMYALIACALFALLVILLSFSTANKNIDWGDIRMALVFHQVCELLCWVGEEISSHGAGSKVSVAAESEGAAARETVASFGAAIDGRPRFANGTCVQLSETWRNLRDWIFHRFGDYRRCSEKGTG